MTMPDTTSLASLATRSVELIVELQDPSGAYPASPTFSAYRGYCWFRDGSFIADGVSAFGAVDSASAFFDWCSRILLAHEDRIRAICSAAYAATPVSDSDMLATRFTFDGQEGDDDWWDFQLDGYGTWIWAAIEHAERHSISLDAWAPAIGLTVDYLASSWSRPCFDWWEENAAEVHLSTLGCIAGGLAAALRAGVLDDTRVDVATSALGQINVVLATTGQHDGHLVKWIGSTDVDASLASIIAPIAVVDGPLASATIAAVERTLTVNGGVHRYGWDTFYGGGQWPLLSCFLGLAHARLDDRDRAFELLQWAASTVTAEGHLPEQVDQHLLDDTMVAEWVERWGSVATPLLWSHAMFARLAVELGVVQ